MYLKHFGLREPPFGLTPDTAFTFACSPHQQALNTLLVAVGGGEGFMKITGEVGTGKTLLCRRFMSRLGAETVTAYIPSPQLDPRGLLLALAAELRLTFDQDDDPHVLLNVLNQALLDHARGGRRVVLCIDEAQAMPIETLESLRLLSNLETEKRKLIQVVLFGQPELDSKLRNEALRQLLQRVTFHYRLAPLTRPELDFYVAHRLLVAGYVGDQLFTRPALRALYHGSGGVPRLINVLAHKAMLAAYGEGRHYVYATHVSRAASDTPSAHSARPPWVLAALVAAVVAAVAGVAYWYAMQ